MEIRCENENQKRDIQAARDSGDVRAMLFAIGLSASEVDKAMARLTPENIAELQSMAAIQAARRDFDYRWGVAYSEGQSPENNDGWLMMVLDITKYVEGETDREALDNTSALSAHAAQWMFEQPEQIIPGVAELFKEKNARHRTGISGGLGSPKHNNTKDALARVLSTLTPEQIKTAEVAAQRMADRLVTTFPKARINHPHDQAATPEEIMDFYANGNANLTEMVQ